MRPIEFPEVNAVLGAPQGMTEEQVHPLPVFTNGIVCVSIWQMTPEEIEKVSRSGRIVLHIMSGSSQPPVLLEVGD